MGRIELPQETGVGQTVTFHFTVRAPPEVGKHGFQWRLVHDGVQWIGALSKLQIVDVQASAVPEFLAAPVADGGQ